MMWIALHTKFSMDNIINKSFLPNKKICLNLPDFPMIILGGERLLCTVHTGLHTAQGDELRGSKNEEIPAGIKCIPRAIHHLLCNTSSHRIWITFKIWISSLTFKSLCTIVSLTKRLMFQVLFLRRASCKARLLVISFFVCWKCLCPHLVFFCVFFSPFSYLLSFIVNTDVISNLKVNIQGRG